MRLMILIIAPVVVATGLTVAPTASADCTSSAGTSVCSQGDVRGANTGQGPGAVPLYNPNQYCWWCDNNGWGLTFVIVKPPRPRGGGGRGR